MARRTATNGQQNPARDAHIDGPQTNAQGPWSGVWGVTRSRRPALVSLVLLSALGGFAEAGTLVLLVRIALGMSSRSGVPQSIGVVGIHLRTLDTMFLVALTLGVMKFVCQLGSALIASRISGDLLLDLRERAFRAFLHAPWGIQAAERSGQLQEMLLNFAGTAAQVLFAFADGLSYALSLLPLLIVSLLLSPLTGLLMLLLLFALFAALRPLTTRARTLATRRAGADVEYASLVRTCVDMAQEIRSFGVADEVEHGVDDTAANASRLFTRSLLLQRTMSPLYQNLAFLLLLVILFTLHAIGAGRVGDLAAGILLMIRALLYSQTVQLRYHAVHEQGSFLGELEARCEWYESERDRFGTEPLPRVERLVLAGASFSYSRGNIALHDTSFAIHEGDVIGIIGPSGAGKSTLVQLLLRLMPPSEGEYLVNGLPASQFDSAAWSRAFAFVPQEPRLFSSTVAHNIQFFREWISDAEIREAAQLAHVHDVIVDLPKGYETLVGDAGRGLSGGQKQRITLARALAGSPDVLVLDEPSSALDLESEARIQATLQRLRGLVTMVIVAHRMSTLNVCDKLLVIENGEIQAFAEPRLLSSDNAFFRRALKLAGLR